MAKVRRTTDDFLLFVVSCLSKMKCEKKERRRDRRCEGRVKRTNERIVLFFSSFLFYFKWFMQLHQSLDVKQNISIGFPRPMTIETSSSSRVRVSLAFVSDLTSIFNSSKRVYNQNHGIFLLTNWCKGKTNLSWTAEREHFPLLLFITNVFRLFLLKHEKRRFFTFFSQKWRREEKR